MKVTATFIGANGTVGYLTGHKYALVISRHKPHEKFGGMLVVDREEGKNEHEVSSESNLKLEDDEDFYNYFECDSKIDFSRVSVGSGESTTAKQQTPQATTAPASAKKPAKKKKAAKKKAAKKVSEPK